VRHLRAISILMTLLGVVAIVAAIALNLSATIVVIGMMLVVAGLVKIAMVALWHTVAGFGAPIKAEAPALGGTSEERRR
jgi:hypothetical protein